MRASRRLCALAFVGILVPVPGLAWAAPPSPASGPQSPAPASPEPDPLPEADSAERGDAEEGAEAGKALPEEDAELAALKARLAELEARLELMEAFAEEPAPAASAAAQPFPELLTALNPRVTVFLNATGRADTRPVFAEAEHGHGDAGADAGEPLPRIDDGFSLRETEVDFRAAVDPFVDGVLVIALEEELPGEFHVGVEEGYAVLKSLPLPGLERPPLGLVTQVGRFRASLGRNNQLHTHDLPQTTRPLAVQAFLGPEGTLGDGVSARLFLPLVWFDELSTVQLTLEAFNGAFPASETDAGQFLANLAWSRPLGAAHRLEVSAIGLLGQPTGDTNRLASLDLLYEWRPATFRGAVVGAQGFWLWPGEADAGAPPVQGAYAFGQWQFSRELFAGLRYDWTELPEDPGRTVQGLYPYVSWYPSEFFRMRLGWEQQFQPGAGTDLGTLWFELNFIFGTHPPHPYWVHR